VGRGLEDVGPGVVEEVDEGVLAAEAEHAQAHVGEDGHGGLAVHQVAVHERVLEQRRHRVDVVLAHLADVLEHEGERLEHAVLHVELWQGETERVSQREREGERGRTPTGHAVLVHEAGQDGEGRAGLGDDGDGDGGADAVLALLDLEVVEEGGEDVVGADGLGDVAEGVDGGAADGLLVRLEQLEQLEADAHPLAGAHELGAAVGDAAHQLDAVLLHLLVPVLEDGREARQQVLDGRRHPAHADHVHDGLERAQDAAQHLRVLLAQVLVQHLAQVRHQLLLAARLHHHRDLGDQVRRLLPHLKSQTQHS